jgi:hypothetical protein
VRLLAEVRAAGYTGGDPQLKALGRQVRLAPPPEAVVRFETPAGRQGQLDFAEFRFAWASGMRCLWSLGNRIQSLMPSLRATATRALRALSNNRHIQECCTTLGRRSRTRVAAPAS